MSTVSNPSPSPPPSPAYDPAALDDIDLPALRASAALHERRHSRPGEKAAAQALLHGSARWPWTPWRDALYDSLQEAAGTMSMDTQQDDERLRTLIWAYVVHHPLVHFTMPRPVEGEAYTLPALISDRMRSLHDCMEWSEREFPMLPDGSTEQRLRTAQEERIACLLAHRLPMPDVPLDEEEEADDSAKKALRRTDSQASTSPVAEPAQNSADLTIPSSDSLSLSSNAPCPASGTSGTAGSASADAARNSLRMPPRRDSADAGSSGGEGGAEEGESGREGEPQKWCILYLGVQEWESFTGTLQEAMKEATCSNHHLNYGRTGYLIVPFQSVDGSTGEVFRAPPPLRPGDIEVRMSMRTDPPPEDGEYTVLTACGWNTLKWAGAWQQTRDLCGSDVLAWCRTSTLVNAVRSMQSSPGPISVLYHPLNNDRCSVLIRKQPANDLPPPDMDALRAAAIAHPVIFNPAAFPSSADDSCDGGY